MKDEEMAEELAWKLVEKGCVAVEENRARQDIKYAYLAGLKAGRPQWHNLEKDPNDLPKEHIPILVMLEYGVPYISFVSTDKRWFCTDYYTGENKVIAWCEIPTFDKE
jgi:hypothetical protein